MHTPNIQKTIDAFAKLPSIGPKMAERLVFSLLKKQASLENLIITLNNMRQSIVQCSDCFSFAETNPCPLCSSQLRNRQYLCVVQKAQEIEVIEKSKAFDGLYFVLDQKINPLEPGPIPEKISQLIQRIKNDNIKEIILAFNPDLEGETMILYLKKQLANFSDLKLSRLARGLPMGADLEYADEITLENALKGRQKI